MSEFKLKTPLSEGDVDKLEVGDIVYLSGEIYTARDRAHKRAIELYESGEELPFDWNGAVIFHCGPVVIERNGNWEVVSAGPTTSSRMNDLEPKVIEYFGVRGIIGKGGMNGGTTEAMNKHKCVYFSITGGAGVLVAQAVKRVKGVYWEDLGMPEAVWVFSVEDLGPLVVTISKGRNYYLEVEKKVLSVKENLLKRWIK
ncbi:fumarate hydratase [Thermococci archaeon]|nr:MAG: fumarate hydratase [Thermococci archaeon]